MNVNIEMFANLDKNVKSEVATRTRSEVFVKGKGIVYIITRKGQNKFVPDVYYVLGLKFNLLSIGQLMNNG